PHTPAPRSAGPSSPGLCKSTNGGGSWTAADTGLPQREGSSSFREVLSVVIDSQTPSTLYAGTWGGGVFKSTDGGGTWGAVNTGLTTTALHAVAVDPRTPATIYTGMSYHGVFKSTDGGAGWSAANTGMSHSKLNALRVGTPTTSTLDA